MLNSIIKICAFILLMLCISSCVKDVDFEQAEDLAVSPILEVSLIFFEESAPRFATSVINQNITVTDTTSVTFFNDDFVVDNLSRAEFLFETTNSIERAFNTEIKFLNDNEELLHVLEFDVPASINNQPVKVIDEEIFIDDTLNDLKETTQLILTLTMENNPSDPAIDDNTIGVINLKSKGTFFIDLISPSN